MEASFKHIPDLASLIEITQDSTLSRTLHATDYLKAVLFGFDAGQELSEHTASMPAVIHIVQGEARLILGGEIREVKAGAWVYMDAHLSHGVYAITPLTMLLLLLKK